MRPHADPQRKRISSNYSIEKRVRDKIRETATKYNHSDSALVNQILKTALEIEG